MAALAADLPRLAEWARERAEACEALVAPASAHLDALRRATLKAGGRTRMALDGLAQLASCHARRSRTWSEGYSKMADLLDDVIEGVPEP